MQQGMPTRLSASDRANRINQLKIQIKTLEAQLEMSKRDLRALERAKETH